MVDKEHSALTGASLHEPKGISSAVANRVYLSNGSGSGSWTTIPADSLNADGIKVFQNKKYHIRDEVSSGTASQGTLSSGSWNTRRLQTEKTDDLTVTLSGNQFTLVAGTYYLDAWVRFGATVDTTYPGFGGSTSGKAHLRLRNITDGTTSLVGVAWYQGWNLTTEGTQPTSENLLKIRGQFTIAGTKAFELQQFVSTTSDGSRLYTFTGGTAVSSGENEVYADLIVWKLT
jgi:hypothetical protein